MLINVQYPEVILNIKDVKAAIDAGDTVGEVLENCLDELDSNITIKDAAESGIAHRENILGIKPPDTSSLEDRRLEVLLRWYDTPVYTETTLRQKLDATLGAGQYILTIDLDKKTIACLVELTSRRMIESVQDLFEQMVPLDYLLSVSLRYNQYKNLCVYTYAQLQSYTHDSLRNEVLT